MKLALPPTLERLVAHYTRLPGIGRATAQRLALATYTWNDEALAAFADDLAHLHERVHPCPECGNYTEADLCDICASPRRTRDTICVVEQASQIAVFENAGCFTGLYHVLGGRISPLSGVGPEQLRVAELRRRLEAPDVKELILATSPDVEGEATANYLAGIFRRPDLAISRIATGIPAGADVAYADSATLSIALGGRRRI
jgi:recombination protein RecR